MLKCALCGDVKDSGDVNINYYRHLYESGITSELIGINSWRNNIDSYDCLVVCGGGDIHPEFYGQTPSGNDGVYDVEYDRFELSVIGDFIKSGKPILGICRGMQSINVAMGGTLIQDIPSQLGLNHNSYGNTVCQHEIKISRNSRISSSLGIRFIVNSYHRQCVHILGSDLYVAAASHDGVIEAIESNTLPVLGVQWHPERMSGNTLFEHFYDTYLKKQ